MISNLKLKAKTLLSNTPGKYALFSLPILLPLVNISLSITENASKDSFSDVAFPLLISFLASFFTISALYAMLEALRYQRRSVSFGDLARSFSGDIFWKLFLTLLLRGILTILFAIPMFIGTALFISGIMTLMLQTNITMTAILFFVAGVVVFILGFILTIYKSYQYSQAEFIVYDQVTSGDYQGAWAAIKESKRLMKGHIWEAFLLYLSFIGWYLLVPFTLCLILIYLLPYINTTRSVYYQYLLEQDKSQREDIIDSPIIA